MLEVAVPADQHGGEADERVQQRDELGHAGHLDDSCAPQADRTTDRDGDDQQDDRRGVADVSDDDERRHEGDRHTGDAVDDALARRLVLGQPREAEDEQQCRDDVRSCGDALGIHPDQPFENMLSMRRVTANPPKTLMLASRIATNESVRIAVSSSAICSMAPTTMMPEIALVTDISGVCSAWCTLPMT